MRALLDHTRCPVTTKELTKLVAEDDEAKKAFARDITDKRVTVYDLLDALPGDRAHARRSAGDDLGHPAALLLDLVLAAGRA